VLAPAPQTLRDKAHAKAARSDVEHSLEELLGRLRHGRLADINHKHAHAASLQNEALAPGESAEKKQEKHDRRCVWGGGGGSACGPCCGLTALPGARGPLRVCVVCVLHVVACVFSCKCSHALRSPGGSISGPHLLPCMPVRDCSVCCFARAVSAIALSLARLQTIQQPLAGIPHNCA
jgi:hypothetical protein